MRSCTPITKTHEEVAWLLPPKRWNATNRRAQETPSTSLTQPVSSVSFSSVRDNPAVQAVPRFPTVAAVGSPEPAGTVRTPPENTTNVATSVILARNNAWTSLSSAHQWQILSSRSGVVAGKIYQKTKRKPRERCCPSVDVRGNMAGRGREGGADIVALTTQYIGTKPIAEVSFIRDNFGTLVLRIVV